MDEKGRTAQRRNTQRPPASRVPPTIVSLLHALLALISRYIQLSRLAVLLTRRCCCLSSAALLPLSPVCQTAVTAI